MGGLVVDKQLVVLYVFIYCVVLKVGSREKVKVVLVWEMYTYNFVMDHRSEC